MTFQPAVFLDRDGVINQECEYVHITRSMVSVLIAECVTAESLAQK